MSESPTPALRRTSLYVSGASPANMIRAVYYAQDCMVYDLEDSVPLSEKDSARLLVYHAVRYHRPEDKYIIIRVNGLDSEFIAEDLEASVRARPNALRIPKVENADEIKRVAAKITEIEKSAGIEVGSTEIWCNIESPMGLANAYEIAKADRRVVAMSLGAEDFTMNMRAQRTKEGLEILYARSALVMACRNAGVDAIDAVFSDINDIDGLKADVAVTKNLGFDGKTVIHPRQIETVNAAFTPSIKEINHALRVLAVVREAEKNHKGAATLDGSMIDKPIELRARTTLALAQAAGIAIEEGDLI